MRKENIAIFNKALTDFKIQATCVGANSTEGYFYYDLVLRDKAKVKDIQKWSDELALRLKTACKPSIKVLHSKGIVRLEFIKADKAKCNLLDIFTNRNIPDLQIPCLLGKSVDGSNLWMDLAQNPHMLIAGTTGSGKSTLVHNIIANLFNYNNVDLCLMDPKGVEFVPYEKAFPKITVSYNYDEILNRLKALNQLMDLRFKMLKAGFSINQIKPTVAIIDEFADLIMQDATGSMYYNLCKLAQKCRAAKIHLIIATQRPSVDVINGLIKANFPARIACKVSSHIDSKIVLDVTGAENLLGYGDALLRSNTVNMERFQVAYTNAEEVCSYFKQP